MKNLGIKLLIAWTVVVIAFMVVTIQTFGMSLSDEEHKNKADIYLAKSWDLANGGLTETADYYWVDKAEAEIKQIEWEALRKDLWAVAHATRVALDDVDKSTVESVDNLELYSDGATLTAYCDCPKCCGKWSGSPTASGAWPKQGVTVANGSLPFGTKVYIEGLGTYTVQDRGVGSNAFDIYFESHSEAQNFGVKTARVYLVR